MVGDFNLDYNGTEPESAINFVYRPLARLWECSQSGVQNNKIFFTEAKISFVLSSSLAAFPQTCKGSIRSKLMEKEVSKTITGCPPATVEPTSVGKQEKPIH